MHTRQTARTIHARKDSQGAKGAAAPSPLVMLTAYDAPTARLGEAAGADILLVGDSLGMVILGYEDTLSVTLDDMVHHCKPVSRVASSPLVVGDMPFLSYEAGPEQALASAGRLVKEGGVRAVKLEGGREVLPQLDALLGAGIPVMGRVGRTPHRMARLGGSRVQGRDAQTAQAIVDDAMALDKAGCFAIVLECVPSKLAALVTAHVSAPTIGIGAGAQCDGQVLVIHDVLGLHHGLRPSFVKRYAELGDAAQQALEAYAAEVRQGVFPGPDHGFSMDDLVLDAVTVDGVPAVLSEGSAEAGE